MMDVSTATVTPGVALTPLYVMPSSFPQHLTQQLQRLELLQQQVQQQEALQQRLHQKKLQLTHVHLQIRQQRSLPQISRRQQIVQQRR